MSDDTPKQTEDSESKPRVSNGQTRNALALRTTLFLLLCTIALLPCFYFFMGLRNQMLDSQESGFYHDQAEGNISRGQLAAAVPQFERSLQLARQANNSELAAVDLKQLADAEAALGNIEQSQKLKTSLEVEYTQEDKRRQPAELYLSMLMLFLSALLTLGFARLAFGNPAQGLQIVRAYLKKVYPDL
jgi:hypothetical protein